MSGAVIHPRRAIHRPAAARVAAHLVRVRSGVARVGGRWRSDTRWAVRRAARWVTCRRPNGIGTSPEGVRMCDGAPRGRCARWRRDGWRDVEVVLGSASARGSTATQQHVACEHAAAHARCGGVPDGAERRDEDGEESLRVERARTVVVRPTRHPSETGRSVAAARAGDARAGVLRCGRRPDAKLWRIPSQTTSHSEASRSQVRREITPRSARDHAEITRRSSQPSARGVLRSVSKVSPRGGLSGELPRGGVGAELPRGGPAGVMIAV